MTDELARVHGLVHALARRERALLVWQVGLRSVVLAAVGLTGAALAVWRDVPHATAVTWIVLGLGVGAWFAVAAPWLRHWRRAGDLVRQARRVEALEPALRGRLLTAVGRPQGPIGQESPTVLALVARRALSLAEAVPSDRVHPVRPVRRWAAASLAAWAVAFAMLMAAPGGSSGVWRWWFGTTAAAMVGGDATALDVAAAARVGDLTLRYVYPDYTGLEPLEVVNSTGEAHGPPGTRVEVVARSAEHVAAASLVAYDAPALDAKVTDGRTISASFSIGAEVGTYQLHTTVDGELRVSRAFPIVPEPDLPPEVTIDGDTVREVAVDDVLPLRWQASDDFGITRVAVQVDGAIVGSDLTRPRDRVAMVDDVLRRRPLDLGMEPGGSYEVTITAFDNDTVAGPKQGTSTVVRVRVLGAGGVAELSDDQRNELLDLLLDILGDHLEESWPPGALAADYARWGGVVNRRFEPLAAFVDRYRGSRSRAPEWPPVEDALDAGRTLVRFSQVSFVPGSPQRANEASVASLHLFRDETRVAVETAVLFLDGVINAKMLAYFANQIEQLSEQADALQAQVDDPEADPNDLSLPAELLMQMMDRVGAQADKLQEGGLKDFVASRTAEAAAQLQSAQDALRDKDVDDARQLMERVTRSLRDMADGIQQELEERAERARQGKRDAEDLKDVLEDLANRQEGLADQLQQIQQSGAEPYRNAIAELWRRIEEQARTLASRLDRYGDDLDRATPPDARTDVGFNLWVLFDAVHDQGPGIVDAAVARDLVGMRMDLLSLNADWGRYRARRESYLRAGMPLPGPGTADAADVQAQIDALLDLLEQLRRRDEAGDPTLRQQVRALEAEQRAMEGELADAQSDARRVAQSMQVTPRNLEPSLQAAGERMGQAGDQLGRGDGVQAQGSQGAASQHIRDAIRDLQKAQESAQRQQQSGSGGGSEGGEQQQAQDDQSGADGPSEGRGELPEPEDFRTPEAYRQALLQGMEGEVPEEYRALKRRYYEELVHQ